MSIVISKVDASPPARATMMIAELLKLKYSTREVSVATRDNYKTEYLEKNPLHTVPLLEDGDFVLADSHAIITYLVSKYGADKRAELYPSDLYLRATIDQRLYFDATIVFSVVREIAMAVMYEKTSGPSEQQVARAEEAYGFLETYLTNNKFVAGNHLTVADVSIVSSISTLDILVHVDAKFEKVHKWWNIMKEQEWYQKANVPGLKAFGEFLGAALARNSAA